MWLYAPLGILLAWAFVSDRIGPWAMLLLVLASLYMAYRLSRWRNARQVEFIRSYAWPTGLRAKIRHHLPQLDDAQHRQIEQGLTQYFLLAQSARVQLAMPSQAVDLLWHEFILYTCSYQRFCRKAFGRFLHHHPAEQLQKTDGRQALRRTWRLACAHEGIDPHKPTQLPLLFALDASLNLAQGFHYQLDCMAARNATGSADSPYCASALGETGGCAGGNSSDAGCSNGCSGGDSSSDSGGGCGGGGCGGGGGD